LIERAVSFQKVIVAIAFVAQKRAVVYRSDEEVDRSAVATSGQIGHTAWLDSASTIRIEINIAD
jgi:hypothetical protein